MHAVATRESISLDQALVAWRLKLRARLPQLNSSLVGSLHAARSYSEMIERHLKLLQGL